MAFYASPIASEWYHYNLQYITVCANQMHDIIARHVLAREQGEMPAPQPPPADVPWKFPDHPPALERLCDVLELSPFERRILLLCISRTLHPFIANLCTRFWGEGSPNYPTFQMALSLFQESHWDAFHPQAPLRYWQVLNLAADEDLTHAKLEVDESILQFVLGNSYQDPEVSRFIEPFIPSSLPLSTSQQTIVRSTLSSVLTSRPSPVQLCGWSQEDKRAIAHTVAEQLNLHLQVLSTRYLPSDLKELKYFIFRCRRSLLLSPALLFLEHQPSGATEGDRRTILSEFIRGMQSRYRRGSALPLILSTSIRFSVSNLSLLSFDVPKLTYYERLELWQMYLGEATEELNGHLEAITSQFNLPSIAIQAACSSAIAAEEDSEEDSTISLGDRLWEFCRTQARPSLDDLAIRIETKATWEDLILPPQHKQTLYQMVAHLRQRSRVYEDWGFAGNERRGLGISALFSGQSGTGKTLAAGIIARKLNLDLYRIDLSSVVSKYIGETEKNLKQVFNAAEMGGAILLFDEADSLFGKRSEVQDSRDRYANMEVSYLLQSIEAYQGLCVLTTNLKGSIDQAFLRRIRFIVQFPFPDRDSREAIWKRIFPQKTPTEGLETRKLSNLNVAGGNIRNIALNAAFLAADAGEPVMMKHLYQATKSEYIKLERLLTDKEVKGWILE